MCGAELHEVTVTDLREKKRTIYRNIDGYEDSVKAHREAAFPISLILQALTVISVKNASASQPIDKVRILNTICKKTSLDSDPPDSSPHYDEVDSGLRAIFALSALPICAKRGLREELGSIAEVLRKDTREREALNLNLTDMAELRDELLGSLAPTFPPKLQDLTLHLTRCVKISDAGIQALCKCMPKALRRMYVAFFGCANLTDDGMKAIGEALPTSLRHLRLSFGECRQVTDAGVKHLASRLPKKLVDLNLNFEGCELLGEEAAASLGRKLPTTLQALVLNFMGCHHVSDHGVATLAEGLPELQQFDLGCFAIAASDVGAVALAAKLPTTLQSFALDLRSTNVTHVGISTLAANVPDGTDVMWQFAKSDGAGNTELTCLKDLRVWQETAYDVAWTGWLLLIPVPSRALVDAKLGEGVCACTVSDPGRAPCAGTAEQSEGKAKGQRCARKRSRLAKVRKPSQETDACWWLLTVTVEAEKVPSIVTEGLRSWGQLKSSILPMDPMLFFSLTAPFLRPPGGEVHAASASGKTCLETCLNYGLTCLDQDLLFINHCAALATIFKCRACEPGLDNAGVDQSGVCLFKVSASDLPHCNERSPSLRRLCACRPISAGGHGQLSLFSHDAPAEPVDLSMQRTPSDLPDLPDSELLRDDGVEAADALHSQIQQQQDTPDWASSLETHPEDLAILVIASAGRQELLETSLRSLASLQGYRREQVLVFQDGPDARAQWVAQTMFQLAWVLNDRESDESILDFDSRVTGHHRAAISFALHKHFPKARTLVVVEDDMEAAPALTPGIMIF
ncbi:fbxl7 [Symbiodinium sp. CCMP2592]|nr:fbxl7 [Symbiodinium sp. CCMP2592]